MIHCTLRTRLRHRLREEDSRNEPVEGNLQFRRRKENKRQAEESVGFLQGQGTQRTRINRKREAKTDVVMWPKRRKTRAVKEAEMFSLEEVGLVELEGEGCRVGYFLSSSNKRELFDMCDSESKMLLLSFSLHHICAIPKNDNFTYPFVYTDASYVKGRRMTDEGGQTYQEGRSS